MRQFGVWFRSKWWSLPATLIFVLVPVIAIWCEIIASIVARVRQ